MTLTLTLSLMEIVAAATVFWLFFGALIFAIVFNYTGEKSKWYIPIVIFGGPFVWISEFVEWRRQKQREKEKK